VKSFIELQTLQVSDLDFVSFMVEGYTGGKTIVSILLLPFVENAYKNCKKELLGPGNIINILINNDFIEFRCKKYISKMAMLIKMI
jgi:hypothetical protein